MPSPTASVFDADTTLTRDDDGTWHGEVSPRWRIVAGANGGYLATFLLRAMAEIAPVPQPRSMTTHFLQRPREEPIHVQARVVHATRSHAYLAADAWQEHGAVLNAVAVFGADHHDGEGGVLAASMPAYPPPEACSTVGPPEDDTLEFPRRFEYRTRGEGFDAFWDDAPRLASATAWVRLLDRRLDSVAVPLFMDCFPPAVFAVGGPANVPTLELTVHWRSPPHTHWHLARFTTRFAVGGYIEEDGELWGEDGRIVAHSRQMARHVPLA